MINVYIRQIKRKKIILKFRFIFLRVFICGRYISHPRKNMFSRRKSENSFSTVLNIIIFFFEINSYLILDYQQ